MQFTNDISIIYNQFEAELHPRAESSACPHIEERKGKTKGNQELGRRERKKRRVDFGKESC